MTGKSRILSGVAANAYGQVVTILTQVVGVPILIASWGLHGFGLWSMLLIIPLFLIVSDFGYSTAAAGMMSRSVAHGDHDDALASFHTALAVIAVIVGCIFVLAGILYVMSDQRPLAPQGFMGLSEEDVAISIRMLPFLLGYVGVSLLSGLVNAVYRVNGFYPLGVMIFETGRLVEQFAVMALAWAGGGLLLAAVAMLCSRVLFTSFSAVMMFRHTPWATMSLTHASRARLRQLSVPAISAMFVPISAIGGVQGITLLVGLFLAPAMAGTFATVRVLYRMVVQIVGTLTRAMVPEFSVAYARNDMESQARITRLIKMALFTGSTVGTAGILLLGPWFVGKWTGGKVELPFYIYVVLSAHSFFGCLWNGFSNLLTGLNLQQRYIFQLLLWNILAVGALYLTVEPYGLLAAAVALAVIDILSFVSVWRVWQQVSPSVRTSRLSPSPTVDLPQQETLR